MTKLEKVINGLECWVKSATAAQECDEDCPYRTTVEEQQVMGECNWPDLFKDARELLIKQEDEIKRTTWAFRYINAKYLSLLDRLEQEDDEA